MSSIRKARSSAAWAVLVAGAVMLISSAAATGPAAPATFSESVVNTAALASPAASATPAMSPQLLSSSVELTTPAPSPVPSASPTPVPSAPASEPSVTPTKSATSPKPARSPSVTFVALGDSMTSGYSNPGPAWPVALDALRADLRLAHNSGVVGASSADMLAGLNREVYRYKPQVLIVLGGINDLYRGGSAAKVLANLEAIARNARAHGLTVVLLTMPHDLIRGIQPKIETLDNGLIAYGRANNVQVIDLRTVIKTHGDTVNNGCHFNALGVKAVAHKIAADLKV